MSDQENTTEVDPAEVAEKAEAEDRRIAEEAAIAAKKCETPKKQEPLKKTASGTGRGLSLAGNRKRK